MKRFGAALAIACACLAAFGAPALAASEAASPASPPTDSAQIQRAGEAAVDAARQLDRSSAQEYLAQNETEQNIIRARLGESSDAITQTTDEIAGLESAMTATGTKIDREQANLRLLARVIYEQPESPLLMVGSSRTPAEAWTRVSDLLSTAYRAAGTKRQLQQDFGKASAQRARLQVALARQQQLLSQLQADFDQLQRYAGAVQSADSLARADAGLQPQGHADGPAATSMQTLIRETWAPLGADATAWALRIASCESGYNAFAVNRASGAAGLFQFLPSTWRGTPYAAQSPFDPRANAAAAAWLYQRYGAAQWECSGRG